MGGAGKRMRRVGVEGAANYVKGHVAGAEDGGGGGGCATAWSPLSPDLRAKPHDPVENFVRVYWTPRIIRGIDLCGRARAITAIGDKELPKVKTKEDSNASRPECTAEVLQSRRPKIGIEIMFPLFRSIQKFGISGHLPFGR
ncbi:hypothetical protein ACMD2_02905 [Ananas comosus]|uniref:Uncharacterized protein n=1 Tax=Ananas comosus TaxID=4615 RepID=A0A199VD26_ANACO|nr:hypothetical protein ACMD2_02905 [Ananas comosus]